MEGGTGTNAEKLGSLCYLCIIVVLANMTSGCSLLTIEGLRQEFKTLRGGKPGDSKRHADEDRSRDSGEFLHLNNTLRQVGPASALISSEMLSRPPSEGFFWKYWREMSFKGRKP